MILCFEVIFLAPSLSTGLPFCHCDSSPVLTSLDRPQAKDSFSTVRISFPDHNVTQNWLCTWGVVALLFYRTFYVKIEIP